MRLTREEKKMPFIGQDWRDNGDQWMKTNFGSWQRIRRQSLTNSVGQQKSSLSDVFDALQMLEAVSNPRRFNYILKLIQIVFKEKLGELSGNAQRTILQIVEQMVETVVKTGDYLFRMQKFIDQIETSIHLAYPFYYYIGSAALWQKNVQILQRLKEKLRDARTTLSVEEKCSTTTSKSNFECLPTEMQCEILKRLDNGRDLIEIGRSNSMFYRVTQELTLWKQLCHYHFQENNCRNDKLQRLIKRQQKENDGENVDWKKIFFRLKKRHGLKEIYAEMISQCQICKNLFWQGSAEHSCLHASTSSILKPLTPRKFLALLF